MKRAIFLCMLAVLMLTWCLAPIPPSRQHAGAYNYTSRWMYCRTQLACLHEIGHALDQQAGYISQSPEFCQALQMYLYTEMRKPMLDQTPADILEITYRGNDEDFPVKHEIYAYLFAWANGESEHMPAGLRNFYDWNTARRLMDLLKVDQQFYWLK